MTDYFPMLNNPSVGAIKENGPSTLELIPTTSPSALITGPPDIPGTSMDCPA